MESEFIILEKQNNGVFPIKLLESFLLDLDVNKTIVNYISLFLKKKTQKVGISLKRLSLTFRT